MKTNGLSDKQNQFLRKAQEFGLCQPFVFNEKGGRVHRKEDHEHEWAAWREWRKDFGLETFYMDLAGRTGRPFQVPCQWPTGFY